jgi:hypothetical protein
MITIDIPALEESLNLAAKDINRIGLDILRTLTMLQPPPKPHKWQKLRGSFYMRDGELVEAKSLDDQAKAWR